MDGAVVEHEDDGFVRASLAWPVDRIEATEEGDEVAAELGGAGIYDQLMSGAVERADDRPLLGPPRRFDAQIAAAFGPGPGEIGWVSASDSSPNSKVISPALACCFNRRRRRPERSTASASCRPFSVCRGRRQAKPPFSAPR
jgi:hypothetical protein